MKEELPQKINPKSSSMGRDERYSSRVETVTGTRPVVWKMVPTRKKVTKTIVFVVK